MSRSRLKVYEFELRQLIFAEIDLRYSEPKAQRKAWDIMEAAIKVLAANGFEGVTLEMIARKAGVTRPAIKHYFKNIDELLETTTRYVRLLFQKMAVEAMIKGKRPDEMIGNYIDACFLWVEEIRPHALTWLGFLLECSRTKSWREVNTAAVRTGEERLQALLDKGKEVGVFKFDDAVVSAKMVQSLITGAMITYAAENLDDPKKYAADVRSAALKILGVG